MGKRKERKLLAERQNQARADLAEIERGLRGAWAAFDDAEDASLAEAALLEIGALRQRYGRSLRALKALYQ